MNLYFFVFTSTLLLVVQLCQPSLTCVHLNKMGIILQQYCSGAYIFSIDILHGIAVVVAKTILVIENGWKFWSSQRKAISNQTLCHRPCLAMKTVRYIEESSYYSKRALKEKHYSKKLNDIRNNSWKPLCERLRWELKIPCIFNIHPSVACFRAWSVVIWPLLAI